MSFLAGLINPPGIDQYLNNKSTVETLQGIVDFSMPSLLYNPDFNFLSSQGTNPTTQADGDNFQFIQQWFDFGVANTNFVITPTPYATNAQQATGSKYFINLAVSSYNGNGFYFYQNQPNTVRKYQRQFVTFTLNATNNTANSVTLRASVFSFFDTANQLTSGGAWYLKPGSNQLTSTLQLPSLTGQTVGANDYTEFRLNLVDLGGSSANVDVHWLKCEMGKTATPLNVDYASEAARLDYIGAI